MPRGKKKRAGRRGRPTMLARTPTSELRRELERRRSMLDELIRQRDQLNAELEELEGAFGSTPAPATDRRRRGPGRPRGSHTRTRRAKGVRQTRAGRGPNKVSLVTALHQTLSGRTLSVGDAAVEVKKTGYKSSSPNFRTMVNAALLANPDKFKKVARGEYTAR